MTLRARKVGGGPARGYIGWWDANDLLPVGDGNPVDTWHDRASGFVSDATGTEGTLRASVGAINGNAAVEGGPATIFQTTTTVDLSHTDKVHAFIVAIGGDNADAKIAIEHTPTTGPAGTNGFAIFSGFAEDVAVQCTGNVGQSRQRDPVNWSLAWLLVDGRFDKARSSEEAMGFSDGIPFPNQELNSNNTDNFSDDFLFFFARGAGNVFPFEGLISMVLLYDRVLSGKALMRTYRYVENKYGIRVPPP